VTADDRSTANATAPAGPGSASSDAGSRSGVRPASSDRSAADDRITAGDRAAAGDRSAPSATARPPVTVESLREIRAALGTGVLFMVIGGFVFTLAGFGFTAMMGTSCFEGFCAYVPFLYFAPLGLIAGFVLGAKIGRAKAKY
jgi:hypothetical protein